MNFFFITKTEEKIYSMSTTPESPRIHSKSIWLFFF